MSKPRSEIDFAIEFGRYLADAAEQFMAEQNRAAFVGEDPDPDFWRALASAIYEFRKRADRADAVTNLFRRLGVNKRRREKYEPPSPPAGPGGGMMAWPVPWGRRVCCQCGCVWVADDGECPWCYNTLLLGTDAIKGWANPPPPHPHNRLGDEELPRINRPRPDDVVPDVLRPTPA